MNYAKFLYLYKWTISFHLTCMDVLLIHLTIYQLTDPAGFFFFIIFIYNQKCCNKCPYAALLCVVNISLGWILRIARVSFSF